MLKRSLAILTLASLLFLSFGVADALHLAHDHEHDHNGDHQQCQVCYLAKVATIGIAISVALYVAFGEKNFAEPIYSRAVPVRVGHGRPQSPRAPPR